MTATEKLAAIEGKLEGLAFNDPRRMALDSGYQNANDTAREGGVEWGSDEYSALVVSSFECSLDDYGIKF